MKGEKNFFIRGNSSSETDFAFDLQRFALSNESSQSALFRVSLQSGGESWGTVASDWTNDNLSNAVSITLLKDLTIGSNSAISFNHDALLNLGGHSLELDVTTGGGWAFSIASDKAFTVNGTSAGSWVTKARICRLTAALI